MWRKWEARKNKKYKMKSGETEKKKRKGGVRTRQTGKVKNGKGGIKWARGEKGKERSGLEKRTERGRHPRIAIP